MKIKLIDKFKILGAAAIGVASLTVPFIVPEAIPALPIAIGGFLTSACYVNNKLSGDKGNDNSETSIEQACAHGMAPEDAIESMLAIRAAAQSNSVSRKAKII